MTNELAIKILTGDVLGTSEQTHEAIKMAVKALSLPSAPRWIPVSEKPPEPGEEVFVYLWGNVPYLAWVYGEPQWETEHFSLDADDAPKAWMPLPGPWKGEER